ncbi:hypothetical protein [Shewanella algae]|uniref:hypothetical protein n=1 Tax=Shewanella algae TaxID=38313 RepID=UPI001AACB69F|nr:hypothetical protein [Shewanella algae]MBO2682797.1 hypothetical protein [Shewanella algae]
MNTNRPKTSKLPLWILLILLLTFPATAATATLAQLNDHQPPHQIQQLNQETTAP